MQIIQIDLNNVKSYRRASVAFAPGTNAICGRNGAGKSTLLQAIGFALFDFLAVKQKDFVREGEKTATVTVHVAGADGHAYHVVRRCGGSSQYYVYDPELDHRLTNGKAETLLWLREFLGVEPATDLAVIFRDAVGVPQGLLTAAFLDRATRRKAVFNPLLRVDEYERVWHNLRAPRRWLEHQIAAMKANIAGMAAEVKALPDLRAHLADLTEQIVQSTQRQIEVHSTLDNVTTQRERLEALKKQLDTLEKHVTQAEAALQTHSARHADAQAALLRSEAAQAVVAATADAHRAYLTAEKHLVALESERVARDKAQKKRQACVHTQELAQQQLTRLEKDLAAITHAEADMQSLAPQVETQTRLEAARDDARRAVERLRSAKQTLKRERQRLTRMTKRLATTQAQLETRAAITAQLQTAQAELTARNIQRETLATQLSTQRAEYKAACAQAQQAARRLKDTQRDQERTRQHQDELEAKRATVQRGLQTLADVAAQIETVRATITLLKEAAPTYTAQIATDQAELERLHTQSTVLTATETADCPVCGAPLSPAHRADLLTKNRARVTDLEAAIATAQAQQRAARQDQRQKEKTLRALERKVKRLPRPADAEDVAAQIATHQRELREREAAVATAQTEVTALATRQTMLKTALDETQPQLTEVEAARNAHQRTVRDLDARLEALPRPAEADALATQVEAQHQIVTESAGAVTDLHDAPDELAHTEAELAALGNPKRAYQRASDSAAKRASTAAQHAATVAQLAKLGRQRVALDAQVAIYADLDKRIAAVRNDRDINTPDHQRYLKHEREAATLTERQTARDARDAELRTAAAHRDTQIAARDAVAQQYDRKAYTDLTAQHSALREEWAGLQASLRHQQTQQASVQAGIARLEARQLELDAAQAERDELTEVQALLEYLRQVLRDAGPEVTRALVGMISRHADRLYGDIMQSSSGQNPAARLRWTADYDIVLTSEGRDRTFQQLSGGEQMAAALAVRLALLREVSTVDIAFFDEPTANLDRNRRANLAKQVLNIQGFGQLFVISHDDTFEQGTDFVVRIEKEGGESRVVE